MAEKHRNWTGNDKSQRNHHGKVRLSEDPLCLSLQWKRGPEAQVRLVGHFRLKLKELLLNKYLRQEDDGSLRLRFFHDRDGLIYIQWRSDKPRIPIGRFR